MENLKTSSNVWIGFRHFIVAGLAAPILLNLILLALGFTIFPGIINLTGIIGASTIISIIGLVLGVLYSVRYLKKTFIISSPNSIINISLIWFIVFELLFTLYPYLTGSVETAQSFKDTLTFQFINVIILSASFYILNKTFLKSNP